MKKIRILQKKYIYPTIIILALLSIIIAIFLSRSHYQQKFVIFNPKVMQDRFLSRIINSNFHDSKYKNILKNYDKSVEKIIKQISEENNYIVLDKNLVITKLPEITLFVEKILLEEMNLLERK